jgi:nucleotide-binding universal stress UspA family protein
MLGCATWGATVSKAEAPRAMARVEEMKTRNRKPRTPSVRLQVVVGPPAATRIQMLADELCYEGVYQTLARAVDAQVGPLVLDAILNRP